MTEPDDSPLDDLSRLIRLREAGLVGPEELASIDPAATTAEILVSLTTTVLPRTEICGAPRTACGLAMSVLDGLVEERLLPADTISKAMIAWLRRPGQGSIESFLLEEGYLDAGGLARLVRRRMPADRTGHYCPSCGELREAGDEIEPTCSFCRGRLIDLGQPAGPGPVPAAEGSVACGDVVGRYRIEREVGRGGCGVVYLATDTFLGRSVALKVLVDTASTPESVVRLHREASIAVELRHPHIVLIYEVGTAVGRHFIAMEFVGGGSLEDRLARKRPSPRQAIECLALVARAVGHGHEAGFVHRDLKPSNILLREDGAPVLTDFGIARPIEEIDALTRTGLIIGTPLYMAPEQLLGQRERIGPPADVWALGAILHQVAKGRPPFDRPSLAGLHRAILDDPTPPTDGEGIPAGLDRIVRRCLEKDPDRRYSCGTRLAEDLESLLAGTQASPRRFVDGRWVAVLALIAIAFVALTLAGNGGPVEPARPIEESPPPVGSALEIETETLLAEGRARRRRGDLAGRARALETGRSRAVATLATDPSRRDARRLLVELAILTGEWDEALESCQPLLAADPDDPRSRLLRAMARLGPILDDWSLDHLDRREIARHRWSDRRSGGAIPGLDPIRSDLLAAEAGDASRARRARGLLALALGDGEGARIGLASDADEDRQADLWRPFLTWAWEREWQEHRLSTVEVLARIEAELDRAPGAASSLRLRALVSYAAVLSGQLEGLATSGELLVRAERDVDRALESTPGSGSLLRLRSAIRAERSRWAGSGRPSLLAAAEADARAAVDLDGQRAAFRRHLGRILLERASRFRGEEQTRAAGEARSQLEAALGLAPDRAASWFYLGIARYVGPQEEVDVPVAIEHFDKALELESGVIDFFDWRARARMGLGDRHRALGRDPSPAYRAAIEDLTAALRLGPPAAGLRLDRGRAWTAVAEHDLGRGADPSFAVERAVEDLGAMIVDRPDGAEGLSARATARSVLLRWQGAEASEDLFDLCVSDFEAALAIDPDRPQDESNLATLLLQRGLRGDGDAVLLERALAGYTRALERDPDLWVARRNRARLFDRLGRPREAVADYEAALRLRFDAGDQRRCEAARARIGE